MIEGSGAVRSGPVPINNGSGSEWPRNKRILRIRNTDLFYDLCHLCALWLGPNAPHASSHQSTLGVRSFLHRKITRLSGSPVLSENTGGCFVL
jgi:hypothetical protein